MPIQNSFLFTRTIIEIEMLLKNTKNNYRFVSQRPYQSKKDPNDTGTNVTLVVLYDSTDYGLDKHTGMQRDNNVYNTFDVTILNGKSRLNINKGDIVSLEGFIPEKSFAIGFDLLLRFNDIKKVESNDK